MRRRRLLLCVVPVALCLIDQTITLILQPSQYWSADYSLAREANPLYSWLLKQHPLAFEAGVLAWILLFCAVIVFVPRRASLAISIAIVMGHAWGTSTWILNSVPHGYWLVIGLYLICGIATAYAWDWFHRGPVLGYTNGTGSGIETSLKGGEMLAEGRWGA